jgi:hypothetical protein
MKDAHHKQHGHTIHEENEGLVKLADNSMALSMTKHIDIRYHYTQERVPTHTIAVISIHTTDMLVDGLTKAMHTTTQTHNALQALPWFH